MQFIIITINNYICNKDATYLTITSVNLFNHSKKRAKPKLRFK